VELLLWKERGGKQGDGFIRRKREKKCRDGLGEGKGSDLIFRKGKRGGETCFFKEGGLLKRGEKRGCLHQLFWGGKRKKGVKRKEPFSARGKGGV